jgi:hypothetical protein
MTGRQIIPLGGEPLLSILISRWYQAIMTCESCNKRVASACISHGIENEYQYISHIISSKKLRVNGFFSKLPWIFSHLTSRLPILILKKIAGKIGLF